MAEVDFDELAKQYGGQAVGAPPSADYDAIASKYGGKATEKTGVVSDVVQSLPGVIPRAASNLIGLPQNLAAFGDKSIAYIGEKLGASPEQVANGLKMLNRTAPGKQVLSMIPNLGDLSKEGWDEIAKAVTGKPFYEPKTGAGRVVDTAGQVLVSGPGSMLQKGIAGASAGVSGEGARLLTDNPVLIGVATILGAGAASLPFILRSVPAENINAALQGVTEAHLKRAQALMDDATKMGTPITGAEALAQVVGRNKLQDIQRVIEGSKESSTIMEKTMNARPGANRAAFESQADQVSARSAAPAETPVKMQEAGSAAITQARKAGNAAASPSYDAASKQAIPASEWNTLSQDPAVQKALATVKNDPIWGVTNEAEGSIRWLDAAKRWIDDELRDAKPSVSRIWEGANTKIKAAADAASPDYAQARSIVADNRQNVVRPLENSPVGDIARTGAGRDMPRPSGESMMKAQSEILMPQSPRALDPKAIRDTVMTLNKQDPAAASQWTRQNIEAIFNESTQNNVAGANQWGGAKFASQIAGNPAQRANLQALVESTSGKRAWAGFERMLEVFEAQGKRLAPGSNTARDLQTAENLAATGLGGAPAAAASPLRMGTIVYDWYQNFRYGKNTAEMANILTDPKSIDLMRQLARETPTSAKATALTAQIVSGSAGARQQNEGR